MRGRSISRRAVLAALSGAGMSAGCAKSTQAFQAPEGAILGNHAKVGHLVREGSLPTPAVTIKRKIVVVGAGVAGLSAVWRLRGAGVQDIDLLELAPEAGGTARAGHSALTPYPWGAHYLPVPNPESRLIQRLCRELGLMTGPDSAPEFNARHLVFSPEDQIFFRGAWYPGLYLRAGASNEDLAQLHRFQVRVGELSRAIGSDGRPAFAVPSMLSSRDPEFTRLDDLTMADWLSRHGLTSERLRWHVDYSCRDDYGADSSHVSAWAALFYFAGRRPIQTPETEGTTLFTWPEGNARLVRHLRSYVPRFSPGRLVLKAQESGELLVWNVLEERAERYRAHRVILATPNHVTARITAGARPKFAEHAPWLVANLSLNRRPGGQSGAWNNVLVESESQGYVDARHMQFGKTRNTVWTWYRALAPSARRALVKADWKTLVQQPLSDLRKAHGDMRQYATRVDLWRWGHGTVIPAPGLRSKLSGAAVPFGRCHFAHTDLSALPLFEEAQYHGVRAAEEVLLASGVKADSWI